MKVVAGKTTNLITLFKNSVLRSNSDPQSAPGGRKISLDANNDWMQQLKSNEDLQRRERSPVPKDQEPMSGKSRRCT